jgi:hypothetical protein
VRCPRIPLLAALASLGALALGTTGCASEAEFTVLYGTDFPKTPHATASVLGVYKSGRLTADTWDELLPRLRAAGALGRAGACPAGFGDVRISPTFAASGPIDDFARANGPTDDLMDVLGPAAQGDTILLLTIAGPPPHTSRTADMAPTSPTPTQAPISGYGQRRGRGALPSGPVERGGSRDRSVFEMSATLFSVAEHRGVAVIAMGYSGGSLEEAYRKFGERLAAELPGLSCAGWKNDAPIDAARLASLKGEGP